MNITIITDSFSSVEFYQEILKKKTLIGDSVIDLETKIINPIISSSLVIIDIRTQLSLEKLEKFKFPQECFVFLISPFSSKYINLPKTIKKLHCYTLEKPLHLPKFNTMLDAVQIEIKQLQYLKSKENLLVDLVENSPYQMAIYTLEGKLSYANKKYLKSNNIHNIYIDHFFDEIIKCKIEFKEILYHLKHNEFFTRQKEHENRWYKSYFYFTTNQQSVIQVCSDITEEKIEFEHLRKTARFFEETNEAVTITDKNGVILAVNKAFCNITGYTVSEALGKSTSILSSGLHEKNFYENLWDNLKFYGRWQGEIWNKRKNGEVYPEWLSISRIIDSETNEVNFMAIFTDISSLKEADKKLHFYANHDHLTGLINRVQFENMVSHTVKSCARNHKKFALLFIDLDHFKDVNDTYGHDIGDAVLKEVASRIRSNLRKEDIVARIGGDEFNVILTNIQEESDAIEVATSLNETIKKPIYIDTKNFYLSLSIGIALYPQHGLDTVTLAKNADQAMYEVKENGRDGVLLYNSSYSADMIHKMTIKNDLKKALDEKVLEIYYQPVLNLHTNTICGAEALVRWHHPTKGFIPPDYFILIAEKHGMILELGKQVVQKVYEDIPMILQKFGKDFKIAINMSSKEFAHETYVEKIIQITKDFNIDFSNIELEITETYIMQNHTEAIKKLNHLKKAGFSLAIDDFGTGYSSLNYLKNFPIDKLKIDKAFVLNILEDESDKAIVQTILQIAKIFHLEVQAEGVESQTHMDLIQSLGCDIAQGYCYAKPLPLDDLLAFQGGK